jgi:acyl-CoA synthetase (AMP-forming)/AMP-acid ligase II
MTKTNTAQSIEAGGELRIALTAAAARPLVHSADDSMSRTGLELQLRAERLAGALADHGLERRRIGVLYRNSAAALEAFIAIELLGGTRLPIDPATPPSEARRTFDAGKVSAVLTDVPHARTADAAALSALTLVHNDLEPLEGTRWTRRVSVEQSKPLALFPRTFANGRLTAIPISYANFRHTFAINRRLYADGGYGLPLRADDCYLTVVQLMYATGLVGSFPFLQSGLPQVMVPHFDAEVVLRAIETHAVTTLFAVPRMLLRIADAAERTDPGRLRTLRRVLYGGAAVTRDEIARMAAVFGPSLFQLYGRYEAGWPLTVLSPEDHQRILDGDTQACGSCGRRVRGVELAVRAISEDDDRGVVVARSGMSSAPFTDADGWCDLGDVGYFSDRGYLHLTGRSDDMINSGGHHIYPGEVRDAILQTGAVSAAFVTGEPDARLGHAVTAYVVSHDPQIKDTLPALLRFALAPHKLPKKVYRVEHLPHQIPGAR